MFINVILHLSPPHLHPVSEAIGCYICSSKNGSDPNCEDPFHPGFSTYSETCQVAKKNHIGKFPANFCVKIFGTSGKVRIYLSSGNWEVIFVKLII